MPIVGNASDKGTASWFSAGTFKALMYLFLIVKYLFCNLATSLLYSSKLIDPFLYSAVFSLICSWTPLTFLLNSKVLILLNLVKSTFCNFIPTVFKKASNSLSSAFKGDLPTLAFSIFWVE